MDSALPQISIVVPVYNVEKYLTQCLDSILSQTFVNFELLLINDGSTDNSGIICDEYALKDKRIKVIHCKNSGVSNARNKGVEHAVGEWITFVDSDDWVDCSLLEIYHNNIACDIDSVVIGFVEEYCTQKQFRTRSKNESYDLVHALIQLEYSRYYGFVWNRIYRTSIIKDNNINFDSEISYCEDHLFTYEYNRYCRKIHILKETPYHHRIIEKNSLSSKFSFEVIVKEALKEKEICLSIYKKYPIEDFLNIINNTYRERLKTAIYSIFNTSSDFRTKIKYIRIICELKNKKTDDITVFSFLCFYFFVFHLRENVNKIKKTIKKIVI